VTNGLWHTGSRRLTLPRSDHSNTRPQDTSRLGPNEVVEEYQVAKSSRSGLARVGFVLPGAVVSILAPLVLLIGFATPVGASGAVVNITDYGFSPSPVFIATGQTVTWINKGAVPHWVEPGTGTYGGGFAASPKIMPGAKYTAKFSSVGTFTYHDALYTFMSGTVVVKAAPLATPKATAKPTAKPIARATAKPIARATAKPTARATAKPTARPTSKLAATVQPTTKASADTSPTAAALVGLPGGSGSGESGTAVPSPGDSSGLGGLLAVVVLAGLAITAVAVAWVRRSRPIPPLVSAAPPAGPPEMLTPVNVPPPRRPASPRTAQIERNRNGDRSPARDASYPYDVDEDAPIEATRRREPDDDLGR
jgi:plastocyanin